MIDSAAWRGRGVIYYGTQPGVSFVGRDAVKGRRDTSMLKRMMPPDRAFLGLLLCHYLLKCL